MDAAVPSNVGRAAPLIPPAPKIHAKPLGVTLLGQLRIAW
jgi:hypothetical protein